MHLCCFNKKVIIDIPSKQVHSSFFTVEPRKHAGNTPTLPQKSTSLYHQEPSGWPNRSASPGIFHHLLQEKMTVSKQVRFRNLLFSHGSQALFSTIFQENQLFFDDAMTRGIPVWLEWRHSFSIKLQKCNNHIGWQAACYPISSRRIWWLQCAETLLTSLWTKELKCGLLSFCWILFRIEHDNLIVRLGIFNYIIGWKWCARKDVWKNRFQMATSNANAPCPQNSDVDVPKKDYHGWLENHTFSIDKIPKRCPCSQPSSCSFTNQLERPIKSNHPIDPEKKGSLHLSIIKCFDFSSVNFPNKNCRAILKHI